MVVSYDRLWKKLIDNKMNKTQLKDASGISFNVLAKLSKNEFVSMESVYKICMAMSMIDHIIQVTNEYIAHMPKSMRKKYGQFFTSKETAVFMAGLFEIPNTAEISALDPGAGSGILSEALVERLQTNKIIKTINLVCYENDPNILELLKENLEWVKQQSCQEVNYTIVTENYILSQMAEYNGMLFANPNPVNYDIVIGNPPYMKISKDAPEVSVMQDVCYGAPNLYFLFAAMSLFNLAPGLQARILSSSGRNS